MVKVIKKDGRLVNFVPEKINISLSNISRDQNIQLNKVDADLITKDVEKRIINLRGNDGITSSYEIISLILYTLIGMGFKEIADSYYHNRFHD
ncbi:hypothetical protein E9840_06945 [Tissierella creatinini]|nr:hypothetical protein E9840_06945 [Tissierella creatinini]TJX63787.1 hypothetical protein E8P77_14215 [Soehngenia saccharolytica]